MSLEEQLARMIAMMEKAPPGPLHKIKYRLIKVKALSEELQVQGNVVYMDWMQTIGTHLVRKEVTEMYDELGKMYARMVSDKANLSAGIQNVIPISPTAHLVIYQDFLGGIVNLEIQKQQKFN